MDAATRRALMFDVRAISAAQGGHINQSVIGDLVGEFLEAVANEEAKIEAVARLERRIALYGQLGFPVPPYWLEWLAQDKALVATYHARANQTLIDLASRGVPADPPAEQPAK